MSIVTIAEYRSVTGDTVTASGTVQDLLDDAEQDLEEFLDRPLALGTYTHRLRVYSERRGLVSYAKATPITDPGDYTQAGNALVGTSPTGGPFDLSDPAYADVTYTGGWTNATLPRCIRHDVIWAAREAARGEAARVPAGATSVSVGDASVSYGPTGGSDPDQRWSRQTRRHRARRVAAP